MARRRRSAARREAGSAEWVSTRPVAAVLDLHGQTAAEAASALRRFVQTQQRSSAGRYVKIIYGGGRSVLKGVVERVLGGELGSLVGGRWKVPDREAYLVKLR